MLKKTYFVNMFFCLGICLSLLPYNPNNPIALITRKNPRPRSHTCVRVGEGVSVCACVCVSACVCHPDASQCHEEQREEPGPARTHWRLSRCPPPLPPQPETYSSTILRLLSYVYHPAFQLHHRLQATRHTDLFSRLASEGELATRVDYCD